MTQQYLRNLVLTLGGGGKELDLSALRIKFKIEQSDTTTPNNATIFVFNLSDETANSAQKEFDTVELQFAYGSDTPATIFKGTIKQAWRGRESPVDTFLCISAADGDVAHNFGTVNKTLKAGYKQQDVVDAAAEGMGLPKGYIADMTPAAASRGKVMYGMANAHLDDVAASTNTSWSIQDGQLQLTSKTGYVPGEAIVLNSDSGMIGWPVQTEGGIEVKALLNPRLKIGRLVQIDNASIQRSNLGGLNLNAPGRLDNIPGLLPKITDDGFYRIYVAEHYGDNRGNECISSLVVLAVDKSSPAANSVSADG